MPRVNLQSENSELYTLLSDMWTVFTKSRSKTGSKSFNEYLFLTGFFFILFAAIYVFIYWVFVSALCKKKNYAFTQMTRTKQFEYVGRVVSIIHAIAVTITSAYGCFYLW